MASKRDVTPLADAQRPLFAGVDLGGTNIKVGLVDDAGRTVARMSIKTNTEQGPEDGARRMGQAVHDLADEISLPLEEIARVGLCSPGTMDVPAGMLLEPHNLPGWFNFPIRERVEHHLGRPVSFLNDANAAAFGEYWVGAGGQWRSMVLFTLGTGIGAGIIVEDLLIHGEHSHGSECGHIIIDYGPQARVCPCGQPGHLEAYCSANSVVKRTEEALREGRKSSLSGRIDAGEELTPLMLAEEAEVGDELSREIVLETARLLGVGIVTLLHTIDPNGVALGGAMTFGGHGKPLGREFLERVRQEVRQRAFPVPAERTTIDYATLGGEAGYIGAAGFARQDYHKQQAAD